MSHINGEGYGSEHNWVCGTTNQFKSTAYHCDDCKAVFFHAYDDIPDIFVAMEAQQVIEHCEKLGSE